MQARAPKRARRDIIDQSLVGDIDRISARRTIAAAQLLNRNFAQRSIFRRLWLWLETRLPIEIHTVSRERAKALSISSAIFGFKSAYAWSNPKSPANIISPYGT